VWITSPGFIVPGVAGRLASLQASADAKVLLRTTDATKEIRVDGERVRPNATYELEAGSTLSVGRFDFSVNSERPENGAARGRPGIGDPSRALFQP
jgi:hypothetical protein